MNDKKHPIQPLALDENGVMRFKENKIVRFLLDAGQFDMNQLAMMEFSNDDREQFAQLIGYSLSGFSELSYVSDETYEAADLLSQGETCEKDARINSLEQIISETRAGVAKAASALFKIHEDDFTDF